ncbi:MULTISPECIES: hypothetical protein [Legionella]|uniref:Uncharacterized protein n=1 Tax=Legionella drozanskii LLAP-1 TaxID=1212489 RepID=A0A0W0TAZ9_9GAMM|nr:MULTISPECIES: hypothetical protein [Legionella]KTC92605.1 hypothetical protein Ldro_0595 [Legionella drozanskii LLAP-1]PJE18204.1 MAG: hypothetical protein CK430_00545 [Legionella sp.]
MVIGRNENNQINSFIIQKTADKPELKFPFEFLKVENDALHYQTTQQFSEYHKNNAYPREQQIFDEGKDLLFSSIQDDIPYDWLRECDSLLDLLSSPEYQSLADNKLQYLYILVFVATHYDYAQFDSILSDCRAENERFSFDLLRQLYTFTIKRLDSGFTTLMTHPDFKRYQRAPYDEGENIEKGREQQLRLLVLAGLDDIQRLAKAKQNQHMCDRMNLPFKARNDIDLIDFCVMLDFPNIPPKEYNLDSLLQDIEQYSDSELRVRRAQVSRLIADYVNTRETLADLEALLTVLKDDSQFGFLREDKMMFDGFGPTVTWKTITYEIKNRAWEIVNETSELTSEKYEQATTIFNEQKGVFEFQTKSFAERFQSLIVDVQIDDKDDRDFSKGL